MYSYFGDYFSIFAKRGQELIENIVHTKDFSERKIDGKMATPYCINSVRNFCFV
jgi:hypothetical protein